MFRATMRFCLAATLLILGGRSTFAFTPAGPIGNAGGGGLLGDTWQIQTIGYGLVPPNFRLGDAVAPKNIAEEYRWNTRNIYYSYDANFLTYFGTNGAAQIDAMFAILNNLSNVDSYSQALSEWPLVSSRVNFTARQVAMLDLKSQALIQMMQQIGLAEPDRYTFTLRNRFSTGPCPSFEYFITERNLDPVTQTYSTYVNGVLYSFKILEECAANPNPLAPALSLTENFPTDPEQTAQGLSAVAAGLLGGEPNTGNQALSELGRFYTGLTRDDVGGFRYLYSSNTINFEPVPTNTLLQLPPLFPSLLVTSNLADLQAAALTNTQAALQALFPTLIITGVQSTGLQGVLVTNFITVTNYPVGQDIGDPPTTNQVPVVTTVFVPTFSYTFGNVLTNFTYTNNGVLVTNAPNEYLLIPSNQCGFTILFNALTSVVTSTNANTAAIEVFTNHTLEVNVFNCVAGSSALREGIEKINFFRVDFDSLISQTWDPQTNIYTLTAITNSKPFTQTFFRTVTTPDFLFSARDEGAGPAQEATTDIQFSPPNFNQTDELPQLAGPGTIEPIPGGSITIAFTKTGPVFEDPGLSFLSAGPGIAATNVPIFQWASFDGTTNTPVVYPVNNSYQNLVNSIFLQITVAGPLPNAVLGVPYSFELTATGATPTPPAYIYTVVSGSLPPGLGLTTSGLNTFISGTPTATGVYDFIVQVTDSTQRTSVRNFNIEVDP